MKNEPESEDPGFGTRITSTADRLINKDGSYNIIQEGQTILDLDAIYDLIFLDEEE